MLPKAVIKAIYGGTLHNPTTSTPPHDTYFQTLDGVICGCSVEVPSSSASKSVNVTSFQGNTLLPTVKIDQKRNDDDYHSIESSLSTKIPQQVTALFASLGEVGENLGLDIFNFPSCLPKKEEPPSPTEQGQSSHLCLSVQLTGDLGWCDFDSNRRRMFDVLGEDFDLTPDDSIGEFVIYLMHCIESTYTISHPQIPTHNHTRYLPPTAFDDLSPLPPSPSNPFVAPTKLVTFISRRGTDWWLIGCTLPSPPPTSSTSSAPSTPSPPTLSWIIPLNNALSEPNPLELLPTDLTLSPPYRRKSSLLQYLVHHPTKTILAVNLATGEVVGSEYMPDPSTPQTPPTENPQTPMTRQDSASSFDDLPIPDFEVNDLQFLLLPNKPLYVLSKVRASPQPLQALRSHTSLTHPSLPTIANSPRPP